MERYATYILQRTLGPLLLICFSLAAIAWLSQSLRFIDMIVNRGLNFRTFLYFSSLLMPSLLWVILPIALFVSISFAYFRLYGDSELVVLKGAGINRFGLAKPAIAIGLLTTMFGYLISFYLMPASYREFKDLQAFIRDNYISVFLQEGVFTNPTEGLTVYIRERDEKGILYGMLVHDDRDPNIRVTMLAEKGQLLRTPSGPRFLFIEGNRQEFAKDGNRLSFLYFDRYALDLSLFIKNTQQQRWREPKERYLTELFFPDDTPEKLLPELRAEAHFRLLWPLVNVALAVLAVIPFVRGEFQRRYQWKRVLATFVICMLIIVIHLGFYGLATSVPAAIAMLHGFTYLVLFAVFYVLLSNSVWISRRQILSMPRTV